MVKVTQILNYVKHKQKQIKQYFSLLISYSRTISHICPESLFGRLKVKKIMFQNALLSRKDSSKTALTYPRTNEKPRNKQTKSPETTNIGQAVGEKTVLICYWEWGAGRSLHCKGSAYMKSNMESSPKTGIELSDDPVILLLGFYPQNTNMLTWKALSTPLFISVLSRKAMIGK